MLLFRTYVLRLLSTLMLIFVLPRLMMLLFPRLLLLLLPMLLLFRLLSLVLMLLRLPCVPEPPAPGRLWLPPLIDGCVPAVGREELWPKPPEDRFEVLGEDRFMPPAWPPPPARPPPPPPPRMCCANASPVIEVR